LLREGAHDTALAAWDVSDINPDKIHLTVGPNRRLRRAGGERYVIHRRNLEPSQRTWWEGIPITTLPTTVADCIDSGVPNYLIRQALERGGQTSMLPRAERVFLEEKLILRDREEATR